MFWNLVYSNLNFMKSILIVMSIGMTASYLLRMSISSTKSYMKNQPFTSNHQNNYSLIPIIMQSLFGVTSGSWMTWLIIPDKTPLINNDNKFMITLTLITELGLCLLLQFSNHTYMKMGTSSISLWFTQLLTTIPNTFTFPIMHKFHNNDKMWQENYGPNMSFNMLMKNITITDVSKSSLMMTLIMLSLLPLFIL